MNRYLQAFLKILGTLLVEAALWLADKRWGDAMFDWLKRQFPEGEAWLIPAIEVFWEYGLPVALLLLGVWFIARGFRKPTVEPAVAETTRDRRLAKRKDIQLLAEKNRTAELELERLRLERLPTPNLRGGNVNVGPGVYKAGDGGPGGDGGPLIIRGGDGGSVVGPAPDLAKLAAIDEIYAALDRAERVYDRGCDIVVGPWRARIKAIGPSAYAQELRAYSRAISDAVIEVADLCDKKYSGFPDIYDYRQRAFGFQADVFNPISDFIHQTLPKLPEQSTDGVLDLVEDRAKSLTEAVAALGKWARGSKEIFRQMRL